jgi:hypothetical protein
MDLARNKELASELKLGLLEAAPGILADYLLDLRTSQNPEDKRKFLELTHKVAMAAEDQKPTLPVFNITIGKDLSFSISQAPQPVEVVDEADTLPPPLPGLQDAIIVQLNADILQDLIEAPVPPQAPTPADPLAFLGDIVSRVG